MAVNHIELIVERLRSAGELDLRDGPPPTAPLLIAVRIGGQLPAVTVRVLTRTLP